MLDKTRAYATIFGDPRIRYSQDGKTFDWQGNCVDPVVTVVEHADPPPAVVSHSEKMKAYWKRRKDGLESN